MDKRVGSCIVSWVFSDDKDTDILLVGVQKNGKVDVVNAFEGKDAQDVYEKLFTIKRRENNE